MRTPTLILALLGATLLLAAGSAGAARTTPTPKTVTVVMHDPGCHWFSVEGRLRTSLAVRGPVALLNLDEAALKVVGPKGARLDPVGKRLVLSHGTYRITMVGQASDDNTLRLVVG